MDAEIRIIGVAKAEELREHARRRLAPIIRHQRGCIEGVSLSVDEAPGLGSEGIRCRILVRLSPALRLYLETLDASAHAAIERAADRLGWTLGAWSRTGPHREISRSPGLDPSPA